MLMDRAKAISFPLLLLVNLNSHQASWEEIRSNPCSLSSFLSLAVLLESSRGLHLVTYFYFVFIFALVEYYYYCNNNHNKNNYHKSLGSGCAEQSLV